MNSMKRLFRFFLALTFTASTAFADVQELEEVFFSGDMNARSGVDFRKTADNIKSLVPRGTRGTVLETRKLARTGSYAVKIRITKVGKKEGVKNIAKEGDESWVYFSQKDPWLAFKDKEGIDVQDPEIALTARAKKDGEGLPVLEGTVANPALPDVSSLKKQLVDEDPNLAKNSDPKKTEGTFCTECQLSKNTEVVEKNLKDFKDIQKSLLESNKNIPDTWKNDPAILKYSESDDVKKTIAHAMKKKSSRSRKLCYRYVKRSLLAGDLIDTYPPGGHAREAVKDLQAQGMINLLDDPKYKDKILSPDDAPKGAVIVYHNDTKESGDIQIKTDWGSEGGYVSDFYTPNNFLMSPKARRYADKGKPYKIIGVMIKP